MLYHNSEFSRGELVSGDLAVDQELTFQNLFPVLTYHNHVSDPAYQNYLTVPTYQGHVQEPLSQQQHCAELHLPWHQPSLQHQDTSIYPQPPPAAPPPGVNSLHPLNKLYSNTSMESSYTLVTDASLSNCKLLTVFYYFHLVFHSFA